MKLHKHGKSLIWLLKILSVVALLISAQSAARAEPVFNLPNTQYEEESRAAAISLIRSIQLIYEAILLLEQNEFSGADGALSESKSEAETALQIYREIEASVEGDDSEVQVRDLQAIFRENPDTYGRFTNFANAIGITAPNTLAEVIDIAVRELNVYLERLGAVNFEGPPFFNAVNDVQSAIDRVVFVGTLIPRLTSDQ